MEGIVYILTHPAMDGIIKIGRTDNLAERMRTLYNTSVPAPFSCYYAARVGNMVEVEKVLHEAFGDRRIDPKREFFTAEPHRVAAALKLAHGEEVEDPTQQDQEGIDATIRTEEVTERKAKFNFFMVDIPLDAELTFVDREETTCRVVNLSRPPRVEYNGETLSVTAAAQKVLGKVAGVNGTLFWTYQGETLSERRDRLDGA